MPYELDTTTDDDANGSTDETDATGANGSTDASESNEQMDERPDDDGDERSPADELGDAIGVTIPDEHVGAFVAEAFEDAERDTTWDDIVEAFVGPGARDAWEALSAREQAIEVLDAAAGYDQRAAETLDDVPLDVDAGTVQDDVEEALRCRRNADRFRDGIAAAYGDGHVADDALVDAVEASAFDTDLLARRESALETVADVHEIDFRPYGGQLFDADDGPDPDVDHDVNATW